MMHLLLLLAFSMPALRAAPLMLVHVSDTHETLSEVVDDQDMPRSLYLSRTAGVIDQVRKDHPESEVVVVHAGDWIAPSIASRALLGQDIVERLNALGVSVAAVGNHDFDLGAEAFFRAVSSAKFPIITANLSGALGTSTLPSSHHVHVTKSGKRIAFVSVVTKDLQRVFNKFGLNLRVEPFRQRLQDTIRKIKSENAADYIIALTHLERAEDHEALKSIAEIDLTLGGHEHELYTENVKGRTLVKVGSDGTSLNVVTIDFEARPPGVEVTPIRVTKDFARAPEMAALEDRTLAHLAERRSEVVAELTEPLDGTWDRLSQEGRQTSPRLGAWVADVMRRGLKADAALMNVGLISRSNRIYPKGPLTRGDLEDIMPWFDPMIVVETTRDSLGRVLEDLLEKAASQKWSGDTPIFAGFEATWSTERPHGERVELGEGPETIKLAINLYLFRSLEKKLAVTKFHRDPSDALGEMDAMTRGLAGCGSNLE